MDKHAETCDVTCCKIPPLLGLPTLPSPFPHHQLNGTVHLLSADRAAHGSDLVACQFRTCYLLAWHCQRVLEGGYASAGDGPVRCPERQCERDDPITDAERTMGSLGTRVNIKADRLIANSHGL